MKRMLAALLLAGCGGGQHGPSGPSTIANVSIAEEAGGWRLRVPVGWTAGIAGLGALGDAKPANQPDLERIEAQCTNQNCHSAIQTCKNDLGKCRIHAE